MDQDMSDPSQRISTRYIKRARRRFAMVGLLVACLVGAADVMGQKKVMTGSQTVESAMTTVPQRDHRSSSKSEIVVAGRTLHVPDVWVVTQDGNKVRFYSDLIREKSVAIGFFFTRCSFVCTWHGELFFRFQKHLAERLGKEISLISVSMDPLTDSPARLKRWGAKYNRRSGWTLLTGGKAEMTGVLKPVAPVKIQSAPNSSACCTSTCFGSPAATTADTVTLLFPGPASNLFIARAAIASA